MPTQNNMDADLARSGLAASDMDAVADPPGFGADSPSYTFPYYLPDGSRHPRVWRKRLYNPAPGKGKYAGPKKSDLIAAGGTPDESVYPYFNPYALAALQPGLSWEGWGTISGKKVTLVEGEKKALSAMKYIGIPAIGFSGAYNAMWRPEATLPPPDPAASATDAEKAAAAAKLEASRAKKRPFSLVPPLAVMIQPGDEVEVVFDGDVTTNPDVGRAAGTLRQVLLAAGAKSVRFVLLPDGLGLDDWLMRLPDKSILRSLFDSLDRTDGHEFAADHVTTHVALDLIRNAKDVPIYNLTNVRRILDNHPDLRGRLWFDVIRNRLYENIYGPTRQITDGSPISLTVWMQEKMGLYHFGHSLVREEIFTRASLPQCERNPVLDFLRTAEWDRKPRLETLFVTGFGAEDTPYARMVGKMWAIGAIARLMKPGCQFDTMLVLEGNQGIGKSKALEILGMGYYVALQQKLDNKDFLVAAHTAWIVDMVELGAMKYADMETIKGLITTRTDTFRMPYGRAATDRPRRFVMVGTTNTGDYLRDDTGNRRYWPIKCNGAINLQWISENCAQIWAEALHCYMANEVWWEDLDSPTASATRAEQAARVAEDPWADVLEMVLHKREGMVKVDTYDGTPRTFVTTMDLLFALGIDAKDAGRHTRHVASLMKRHEAEWASHFYQSKTKPITTRRGDVMMRARGYVYLGPAPTTTDNVTHLPPKRPKL